MWHLHDFSLVGADLHPTIKILSLGVPAVKSPFPFHSLLLGSKSLSPAYAQEKTKLHLLEGNIFIYTIWNSSTRKMHPLSPIYLYQCGLTCFLNSLGYKAIMPLFMVLLKLPPCRSWVSLRLAPADACPSFLFPLGPLLSGTRHSRLILYPSCPSDGISRFSKDPCVLLLKTGI